MAQPLPTGWEAKFDAGSGRYYFINHYNKQTTWVDPRGAVQPQQPVQSMQHAQYSQQSAYPQQGLSSYAQQEAQRQEEQRQEEQRQEAQRQEAQRQEAAHRSRSTTPESILMQDRSPQPQSRLFTEETEMAGGSTFESNADMVSDAEKKQMISRIKNTLDLEGVSDELILMSLDGVLYDENMAVQVFQSMGFKKKGERATAAASSSDRWETTTPKQHDKQKKKKKEKKTPTATSSTASSQPIPSLSEISSQPIPSLPDTSFGTDISFDDLASKFKMDSGAGKLFASLSLSPEQGSDILSKMTSAADVSVRSMFADSSASSMAKMRSAATPVSVASTYKRQEKVGSLGANAGLARGPNAFLLSKVHVAAKGADARLSVGAQKGLARGQSKLARGANKSIARGADRSLRVGKNPLLAKGPRAVDVAV